MFNRWGERPRKPSRDKVASARQEPRPTKTYRRTATKLALRLPTRSQTAIIFPGNGVCRPGMGKPRYPENFRG